MKPGPGSRERSSLAKHQLSRPAPLRRRNPLTGHRQESCEQEGESDPKGAETKHVEAPSWAPRGAARTRPNRALGTVLHTLCLF